MSQFGVESKGCSWRRLRKYHLQGASYFVLPFAVACGSEGGGSDTWPLPSVSVNIAPSVNPVETVPATTAAPTAANGTVTAAPTTGVPRTSAPEPATMPPDPILEALPVAQLRLLPRLEYVNTVAELLQADTSQLDLPEDTHIAGFGTVGALAVTVNGVAAESYERASQALAVATFSDEERWPSLVGCDPQPNGGKSALDQTLLYGATEVSEPNGHVMVNYHLVLAGHAGGKMPGNQHLRFPGSRNVTELQLTMLRTLGVELERFGSWDNTSNTIPEIMG